MSTYTLFIKYPESHSVEVGAMGLVEVQAGWYLYVGSAKTSWKKRVARHLSRKKKLRWHIDYLLTISGASIIEVWLTSENVECTVATVLLQLDETEIIVKKMGSSDCRCQSHFFCLKGAGRSAREALEGLGFVSVVVNDILEAI